MHTHAHTHGHLQPELESQRQNGLASIQQSLAESRAAMGMGGCEVERGEYLMFNSRVQPVARESEELLWTDVSGKPRFVIGNEVRNPQGLSLVA